jgi:hypothetical protein
MRQREKINKTEKNTNLGCPEGALEPRAENTPKKRLKIADGIVYRDTSIPSPWDYTSW